VVELARNPEREYPVWYIVKEVRKYRDMTQPELAEQLNIPREYISLFENGKKELDPAMIRQIGIILNCESVIDIADGLYIRPLRARTV
jgi:transcriptional regulator with XRE-family HTH domain